MSKSKNNNIEELISKIYTLWDFCTESEQQDVTKIDDKLATKGSLGPHEIMALKRLLRELQNRRGKE